MTTLIVLMVDLVTHYERILPPTISRKKRESERKVPIRKRTKMVDARLSRSNILPGADKRQLLAQQHAAQGGKPVQPPVSSPPPTDQEPISEEPESIITAEPEEAEGGADVPLAPEEPASLPPMPTFKEPPPEPEDDLPPRPNFKEPPPESDEEGEDDDDDDDDDEDDDDEDEDDDDDDEDDDDEDGSSSSGSSSHAEPAPEPAPEPPVASEPRPITPPPPPPPMAVPARVASPISPRASPPPVEEAKSTLTRASSAGLRGPRMARGPRAPGGSGAVSSMVQNLNNRASTASPLGSPTSPSIRRLSGTPSARGGLTRTPAGSFSRRTMASDAEDDIVDKK